MVFKVNENHLWLTTHGEELEKYSGKWIAIYQAKLIAFADTLQELSKKSEVKSAEHPLFFLVPEEGDVLYIFLN